MSDELLSKRIREFPDGAQATITFGWADEVSALEQELARAQAAIEKVLALPRVPLTSESGVKVEIIFAGSLDALKLGEHLPPAKEPR